MSIQANAALLGLILCLGLICLFLRFAPARASLSEALENLSIAPIDDAQEITANDTLRERLGNRLYPHALESSLIRIPRADLAILRISVPYFLGGKVLAGLAGLLFLPITNLILTIAGKAFAWQLPIILSLALGVLCFMAPDIEVRNKAAAAREEFGRSLGAYIEFVALNRLGAVGPVQSLERAAAVGDSWVFRRLNEELDKAQRAGQAPWDTLTRVSRELDLPDLAELADIMTLTGEQGVSVATNLADRASSMRNKALTDELGNAGSATEKLQAPLATLGLVFMIMLVIPAIGNILNG